MNLVRVRTTLFILHIPVFLTLWNVGMPQRTSADNSSPTCESVNGFCWKKQNNKNTKPKETKTKTRHQSEKLKYLRSCKMYYSQTVLSCHGQQINTQKDQFAARPGEQLTRPELQKSAHYTQLHCGLAGQPEQLFHIFVSSQHSVSTIFELL